MTEAKKLTRNEIAKAAGVSPSTVSRALAGSPLLPEETIEKIKKIAGKMGYTPNILAKRLAANKSFQIAFAVPLDLMKLSGPFKTSYFSDMLNAITKYSYEEGYSVSVYPYESDAKKFISEFKRLYDGKCIDGIIIMGLKQDSKIPAELAEEKIPTVLAGSYFEKIPLPSVNFEPAPAISEMIKHLEEKGIKKLFFVHGNLSYFDAIKQKNEVLRGIAKSKLQLKIVSGNYTKSSGCKAAAEIMPEAKQNECVFLANDRMAAGFYRYCHENNIAIPGRISVIGSDDDEFSTFIFPELTTIRQPRMEAGRKAVELLKALIDKKEIRVRNILIDETFITRNSTI